MSFGKRLWRYTKRLMLITILCLVILFLGSYFYVIGFEAKVQNIEEVKDILSKPEHEKPINILLLGSDTRNKAERGRSDTIIIASILPSEKKAVLISIPRDYRVNIPGYGMNKINFAYSKGGPSLAIETIKNLTGMSINHFASVDFKGFSRIIDALGGVEIDVEKRMYDGRNDINLYPGKQLLDGKKALAYVRWRLDPLGDLGRIKRQQKFFGAIAEKGTKISSLARVPEVISIISDNLKTDLSVTKMISFAKSFYSIKKEDLQTVMLPGVPKMLNGGSYVIPDEEMVSEIIYYIKKDCFVPEDILIEAKLKPKVAVSITNESGSYTWGKIAKERLSSKNFNVVSLYKTKTKSYLTAIYYKPGEKDKAEKVRESLGFGEIIEDETRSNKNSFLVILGEDYYLKFKNNIEKAETILF